MIIINIIVIIIIIATINNIIFNTDILDNWFYQISGNHFNIHIIIQVITRIRYLIIIIFNNIVIIRGIII